RNGMSVVMFEIRGQGSGVRGQGSVPNWNSQPGTDHEPLTTDHSIRTIVLTETCGCLFVYGYYADDILLVQGYETEVFKFVTALPGQGSMGHSQELLGAIVQQVLHPLAGQDVHGAVYLALLGGNQHLHRILA